MTITGAINGEAADGRAANESTISNRDSSPNTGHDPEPGRAQVFHGPFSYCSCKGCMADAKKEAESRMSEKDLAFGYIKKLEGLVQNLQLQIGDDESVFDYNAPAEIYCGGGRMGRRDSTGPFDQNSGFPKAFGPVQALTASENETEEIKQDEGPKLEIKRMKKTYNNYGDPRVERDRTQPNAAVASSNFKNEHVLLVFREFDKRKSYWRRTLEIRSAPFIELLRGMVASDIDLPSSDEVLRLKEPLMLLFHNRSKLAQFAQADNKEGEEQLVQTKEHTKLILDFLRDECQEVSNKLNEIESSKSSGLITYDLAWLLYSPGTVVFSKENGEYEAFMIESIRGCQKHQPCVNSRHSYSTIELVCWSINYDGEIFGRVWSTHFLAPYEGTKEITALPLVPEAFLPDRDRIKQSLVERGQKFWSLQGQCFREYAGEVWSSQMNEDPIRVMVDHLTYQRRKNWPIEIDRKRGPAEAHSKNWRENKFARRRNNSPIFFDPPPPPPRTRRPQTNRVIQAHGDNIDYEQDRYVEDGQYEEAYERIESDRPPQGESAIFKKYDVLKPNIALDETAALLCPQAVHGYCLRDKVWSK